jgi:phage tail-like protein
VQEGKWSKQRRAISVTFTQSNSPDAIFEFTEAWPTRYRIGEMKTDANDVEIEEIEIAYEGFKRESA